MLDFYFVCTLDSTSPNSLVFLQRKYWGSEHITPSVPRLDYQIFQNFSDKFCEVTEVDRLPIAYTVTSEMNSSSPRRQFYKKAKLSRRAVEKNGPVLSATNGQRPWNYLSCCCSCWCSWSPFGSMPH